MIPLLLRMKVKQPERRPIMLCLPLFLIWLVFIPLVIGVSPLILIAAGVVKRRWHARLVLSVYPILFSSLWTLSGLHVKVEKDNKTISIVLI